MFLFAWFLFVPLYLCCNTQSYCTSIVASIICANTSTQVASGRRHTLRLVQYYSKWVENKFVITEQLHNPKFTV